MDRQWLLARRPDVEDLRLHGDSVGAWALVALRGRRCLERHLVHRRHPVRRADLAGVRVRGESACTRRGARIVSARSAFLRGSVTAGGMYGATVLGILGSI